MRQLFVYLALLLVCGIAPPRRAPSMLSSPTKNGHRGMMSRRPRFFSRLEKSLSILAGRKPCIWMRRSSFKSPSMVWEGSSRLSRCASKFRRGQAAEALLAVNG